MTFNEYINLKLEDTEEIFNYYLNYLENLNLKEFPYDEQFHFQGIVKFFLKCIENATYLDKDEKERFENRIDNFRETLKFYNRRKTSLISNIFNNPKKRLFQIQDEFEEIYSTSLKMIEKAKNSIEISYKYGNLEIVNFYNPKNSNKEIIKSLIREAVSLIEEDISLTAKTKKELIDYLKEVLKKLDSDYTSWSSVIGNIKEVIMVLAALVTVAGPVASLIKAKEKLEETDVIIQKTSININYNSINETFNVENVGQLKQFNSNILLLNENNNNSEE